VDAQASEGRCRSRPYPDLFVDPKPYENHHFGHWAETLAFTHGALILWSKMELAPK